MKNRNFNHLNCPVADTLGVIGEHWSMLIIRDAFFGVRYFNDFLSSLGIARNILSDRLRRLVAEGVLEKRMVDGRNAYELTAAGRELQPILVAMAQWGETHRPNPAGDRITFVDRESREVILPLKPTSAAGKPLAPDELRVRFGPGLRR